MTTTPIALAELVEGQASATVTINENSWRLAMFTRPHILDRNLTAPPGGEANGDVYLVLATGTGDWTGHDGQLAGYLDGWLFQVVTAGTLAYVEDEAIWIKSDGAAWTTAAI